MIDTISALRVWFDGGEDVYAGGDMLIYYHINDNETRVAPDVFVVFGVGNHSRHSWIVWREGKPPNLVMELASGSTWRRDEIDKRDIYAGMGVTEYWRFDPTSGYLTPPLVGERLEAGEYTGLPLDTDADGTLRGRSAVLGMDISVMPDGSLRLYDPATGQWLRTHHETREALKTAEEELRLLREQLRSYQADDQA